MKKFFGKEKPEEKPKTTQELLGTNYILVSDERIAIKKVSHGRRIDRAAELLAVAISEVYCLNKGFRYKECVCVTAEEFLIVFEKLDREEHVPGPR